MKGPQKVAKNHNGAGAHTASTSHVTKKPVMKGSKKSMKVVARNSIATNGTRNEAPKCETQSKPVAMKNENLSLQGRAITTLTDREWEQLMEALDGPQEPGPELRKMCQKYA